MAKLLIFRGESPYGEHELSGGTVRIGRGPQNDLVLEDPGKGVSRNHAEIRFEGGRYTLADRESQNGIWVAGERVASVVLGPDVIAAVGPYRLRVVEEIGVGAVPIAPSVPVPPPVEGSQPVPEPAVLELDDIAPSSTKAAAPVAKIPSPPKPRDNANTLVWIGSAAAIVVIAVVAYVAYRILFPPPPPQAWDLAAARTLVAQGRCPEALQAHINPALNANPGNQEAVTLRDACTTSTSTVPPTTSVPAGPTVDDTLNEAETLLNAKDCQKALDVASGVLAADASNARATDLAAKAKACLNAARGPAITPEKPAVPVPPSEGGLDPEPKETDKAYKTRIAAMRARYDEAITALDSQQYLEAAGLLDKIASEVPEGYLDLAVRREEARNGARTLGKRAFDTAQAADKRDDFDNATESYRRAMKLDPGLKGQVDAALQRMNDRKIRIGTERCKEGLTDFATFNNAAAIPALKDAVRLLPQSDECHAKAREALQKIKGGY